jgi:hypothetical protein
VAKVAKIAVFWLVLAAGTHVRAEELDRAKLDQARSVLAEAVLLEQAVQQGRVTAAYADGLRQDFRQDLETLKKQPAFANVASDGLDALARRDVRALTALRDLLVRQERSHGRAG